MGTQLAINDRAGNEHTGWVAPVDREAWEQFAPTARHITSFWCGGCTFQDVWVADIDDEVAQGIWRQHADVDDPRALLTDYAVVSP